jgi:hypothetical protein
VNAHPLVLSGSAEARGRAHAAANLSRRDTVRTAMLGGVEKGRADGVFDENALKYLAAQRAFHEAHDPHGLAEIRGIAAGFDLPEADLFTAFHIGMLTKGKCILPAEADGCSSWAAAEGPDGPLVVKNRDASGTLYGLQHVALHSGPDIASGHMLCVGSIGAPASYSSGINGWGFALADTHIPLQTYTVGWHRYFLMGRLLADCRSVAEALAVIRSAPHAGGGSITMADASGATATVEFADIGPSITEGAPGRSPVLHTNTLKTSPQSRETVVTEAVGSTSNARYAFLESTLPSRQWDIASAKSLMATHHDGGAPLCQHAEREGSQTLSTAIFACAAGTLDFSPDNPCNGTWHRYTVPKS